jgi:hypothetical protein
MNIYLILSHIIVAIIAFIICCFWQKRKPKTCEENGDYDSSSLISDDATRVLVDKFHETLNDSFDPILIPACSDPFTEAALAYVSFADLKKYMCFIENLSRKNGLLNVSNLGTRMYYGRYPYTSLELEPYKKNNIVDESVVGRHTLVMVPTFRDEERDIDFNPHFIEKGNPMRMPVIRKMRSSRQKQQTTTALESNVRMASGTTNNITTNTTDTPDTNVNLNTFGLTPPKANDGDGAIYLLKP